MKVFFFMIVRIQMGFVSPGFFADGIEIENPLVFHFIWQNNTMHCVCSSRARTNPNDQFHFVYVFFVVKTKRNTHKK